MPKQNHEKLIKELGAKIKKLEKEKAALEKLAFIDPLTGLFNSRALKLEGRRFSAQALRNGGYVCVLYADLDKFGMINNLFGHDKGDAILKKFAKTLFVFFNREIDIVSRKSGGSDEFICVWIAKDLKLTRKFIRNVRRELSEIPLEKRGKLTFSASIGFSFGKPKDISLGNLIKKADKDMYRQKRIREVQNNKGADG